MFGTLVNAASVIVGGLLGLLLKKGIPDHIKDSLMKVQGLAIVLIGLAGVMGEMFSLNPETGKLNSSGGLVMLVSLTVGCLLGEVLRLDDRINAVGLMVEKRFKANGFAKGFVTASLVYCLGALAIIGPINEGLAGDRGILYIKSILDGITSIILSSTLGIGVPFSAAAVFVYQSIPSLLAVQLSPYITPQLLSLFCMVGYAVVTAMGCNFLCETKVKIANLIPALPIPVLYYFLFT